MAEPLSYEPRPGESRRGRIANVLQSFVFGLRVSWRTGKARTLGVVTVPLVESIVPAAMALVLRGLVNATLPGQAGAGGWSITTYVGVSLALSLALVLCQSLQLYLEQSNTEALEHRLAVDVIAHADTLPFDTFERPEFQDTLNQVRLTPGHHVHEMVAKCVRAIALLITLLSLFAILAVIEPLLLVFLVPLAVPYLVYRSWVAKTRYRIRFAQNRSQRWVQYYTHEAMSEETLPEIRALDLGPLFEREIDQRLARMHREDQRAFRLELLGSSGFNSIAVIGINVALLAAANRAADGDLTAGDIAVFAGAATGLRLSVDAFVSGMGSLRWHLAHLSHLRAFFAIPSSPLRAGPHRTSAVERAPRRADAAPALSLRDVTFAYPGTDRRVLDGVSLEIAPGETVGLVGRNGSGKSTIVKLVNGLYVPDAGTVAIGGVDVRDASFDFLHTHLSTVFQTVGRYSATVHESIAMGDWRTLLDQPERVEEIARKIGIDDLVQTLPNGYETTLGRAFGDVSISGGQWQMLAIARAFARSTPLMILDEPTSSLDPEAEFQVFERFKELAAGRATLLVSHRFTTLALADRIVVLDGGRADEQGTHDELVALDGTYAHLHRLFRVRGETGVWKDGEPA